MRHQHQASPTNNPVGSTGINSQYSPHFSQPPPPQHSQQSQLTARSSTPMLMINNPQQFQQGHQRQTTRPVQQQVNQQVRPSVSQQFNPQFNHYTPPHASPLLSQPPFNPQYPPPYPGQWLQQPPSVHSNIKETSELIMQVLDRQLKLYQAREDACKECKRWREEREKKFRDDNNNRNRINKAFKKVSRFYGFNPDQCLPWMEEIFAMATTRKGMLKKNCSTTLVETCKRPCIPCPLKPQMMKFVIFCCDIIQISKVHLSIYQLFNQSNKDLKSRYRHTMQDTSHSMSWHMKALPLKAMDPRLAASIVPTL